MVRRGDIIKYIRNVSIVTLVALMGFLTPVSTYALSDALLNMYAQNNILFYDPDGRLDSCISSGMSIEVCGTELPQETIKMMENAKIKEKAEQNIERYKYAEEKTGVPWQAIAALHYREGGMGSDQSISNGEKLYEHINVDGIRVQSDPNRDAEDAAKHFISNAKNVYGVDVLSDRGSEAYGRAFLAYNRGYMYKCNGNVSYLESPYVMNYYDSSHMKMRWVQADSYDCRGKRLNSVAGKENQQLGALAVMAYLCGSGYSSSSSSSSSSGSGDSGTGGSVASSSKGCATYDGDYPEYIQKSDPWGSVGYPEGSGKTIGSSGCGAASMAMLATYATGQDIYPQDVANLTKSSPYYATTGAGMANLDKKVCEQYGCEVITVPYSSQSDALAKLEQYLKEGYVIHLSGAGSQPYSRGGHYVGLAGYHDGKTMVLNSAFGGNKEYSVRDVVYNGMHGGAFSAIRGSRNGGKCSDLCSSSLDIDAEGGLTKEQAQKLADYYNSNKVSVSKYGLPYGKMNCVSFVAFFVQHFTDVGIIGSYSWTTPESGNGARSTVSVLKNNLGFQTGASIKPFSVFSIKNGSTMCKGELCGHTGVVVGVQGDKIITIEAAYEKHDARVFEHNKEYFANSSGDPFAYADSKNFNNVEMTKIVGN